MLTTEEPNVNPTSRYGKVETAKILGICRTTLNAYIRKGYIRVGYRKATSKMFVKGSEIIRFWNAQM